MTGSAVPLADVQRLVLAGPGRPAHQVTYALLEVVDAPAARRRLASMLDESPGHRWRLSCSDLRAETVNGERTYLSTSLGLTAHGLAALGVSDDELATFPFEFKQGPHARCGFLGDIGVNAPDHWLEHFTAQSLHRLHVVISVWEPADHTAGDEMLDDLARTDSGMTTLTSFKGHRRRGGREPFGFRDGMGNPRIAGVERPAHARPLPGEEVALGEFVLGHESQFGDRLRSWRVPGAAKRPEDRLGMNGSFAALRVMRQDVDLFRRWMEHNGELAAQLLCGVTFDGDELFPNGVGGAGTAALDHGVDPICVLGSHVARANPQHNLVSRVHHRRRIIRRGMPYEWSEEEGLIGLFICANLGAQYEGVLGDWMNNAVHDPRLTGTSDPLVGYQGRDSSRQFVITRGVSYLFLPGRAGLQRIVT